VPNQYIAGPYESNESGSLNGSRPIMKKSKPCVSSMLELTTSSPASIASLFAAITSSYPFWLGLHPTLIEITRIFRFAGNCLLISRIRRMACAVYVKFLGSSPSGTSRSKVHVPM
jgi:hypothetical protein